MMRWLDPLGSFKWPSLLLVASPIAAFPFWAPHSVPATYCGQVSVQGRAFDVYRPKSPDKFILRPSSAASRAAGTVNLATPLDFDAGGMVVAAEGLRRSNPKCFPES